ncbi:MAG: leucine-rich repeat protein, partial [Muribaculaceae bacterium]|nr:leucine-rich repeat protein [Muribaculaceae bacterium]
MKITSSSWLRGIALSLLAVFTLGFANAAKITVNGINYTTKTNGTATVAKYTINKNPADTLWYTGDIVIPETITDDGGTTYTVVGTDANSFKDCKDVTSVVLPNTCVTIGRATFTGCTSLKVSPIPETVESVGSGVFKGCTSLEEVTITNGWGKDGFKSETFSRCPLKKLIIADGFCRQIKANAWGLDTDAGSRVALTTLQEIYFGGDPDTDPESSVALLNNEQPFHNMSALTKVTFGGTSTRIVANQFQGCTALQEVIFNEGVAMATIGSSAFSGCTSLQSFAFPSGVTEVAISTFFNCKALANVTLHDGITSIGATAFYNTALTSINLPNAITSIGQ